MIRCECGHSFDETQAEPLTHRVACGDSTKAEDVARLMGGGETADVIFTSPPYAQQRDYTKKIEDWDGLMQGVFGNLPANDKTQVLVNLGLIHRDGEWVPYWDGWIEWMREQGWRRFGWYVWDQGSGLPGDWSGRLAPSHEFIFHFNKNSVRLHKWVSCKPENVAIGQRETAKRKAGGVVLATRGKDGVVKHRTSTDRNATKVADSVVRVSSCATIDMARNCHPATYPIELAANVIRSWPGSVYDPFGGSGTTTVAGETLGRRVFSMEIEPKYVAVTLERLTDMGCTAKRVRQRKPKKQG